MSFSSPPTLRRRLSMWLIGILSVTLLGVGLITIFLLQGILYRQIDHHLNIVINESAHIISTHTMEESKQLLRQFVTENGMTIVVIDNQGEVILETNSSDIAQVTESQLQLLVSQQADNPKEPVHFSVAPFRFTSLPITIEGRGGILAVGYSSTIVRNTFFSVLAVLLAGLLMALSASIWGIRYLMLKYLEPLEHIAHQAERITTTRNLSVRLETDQETLEVKTLAEALNTMMERLNLLFNKEHAFFSDAAHSLKTPLAVLRSKIESHQDLQEKQKQDMLSTVEQSADIIQDLLLISRLETEEVGEVGRVSISHIMAQTVEIGQILAKEKGVTIEDKIDPSLIIRGNEGLLKRAFANVLFNAIIYTKKKGHITITANVEHKQDHIKILIKDTGMGIRHQDIPKVFDRFYRSKKVAHTPGTGLGLAITKAIIEAHMGTILLMSRVGQGTKVVILLPQVR